MVVAIVRWSSPFFFRCISKMLCPITKMSPQTTTSSKRWSGPSPRKKIVPDGSPVAILRRWPYCTGGHIAPVAILHRWPYCAGGHIAPVAILRRWSYCTGGHIVPVAVLHRRPYCAGGIRARIRTSVPKIGPKEARTLCAAQPHQQIGCGATKMLRYNPDVAL